MTDASSISVLSDEMGKCQTSCPSFPDGSPFVPTPDPSQDSNGVRYCRDYTCKNGLGAGSLACPSDCWCDISTEEAAAVAAYKSSDDFDTDAEAAYLATLDACGVQGGSITDVADCPTLEIDLTSDSGCAAAKNYFNTQCDCAAY